MARTVIDQNKIKEINILYVKYKTYAAVARELGIAASTVKKYIIPNFTLDVNKVEFNLPILEPKRIEYSEKMCDLTEEEFEEVKELWKEMMM